MQAGWTSSRHFICIFNFTDEFEIRIGSSAPYHIYFDKGNFHTSVFLVVSGVIIVSRVVFDIYYTSPVR